MAIVEDVVERLTPLILPEHLPAANMIVEETISQIATHHSGPLPRADELAAYKDIDASFAERIFRMAEIEQAHRHALPGILVEREYSLKARGQHYALLLATFILLFAGYLAYLGDTDMAGKVAIGTLIGIVSIFVGGRVVDAVADARDKDDQAAD